MIDKLKELILSTLDITNGYRETDLHIHLMGILSPTAFSAEEYLSALHDLLVSASIRKIKYYDPSSGVSRLILFSKGTGFLEIDNAQLIPSNQKDVAP